MRKYAMAMKFLAVLNPLAARLACCSNHLRNTQRLKGIDGGKLDRHDAGHDGRLEDGESLLSKGGGTWESVADMTDCLGCMTDPIDGHLD